VKVERPQRSEDERPWRRRRTGACWPRGAGRISPRWPPPCWGWVVVGALPCAGAQPYLGARAAGPATWCL